MIYVVYIGRGGIPLEPQLFYAPDAVLQTPDLTKVFRGALKPLPDQPYPANAFQSWTSWYNLNLIGKDRLPIRQMDWPVPIAPTPIQQTWTVSLNTRTLAPVAPPPNQDDWPLPTQPYRIDQTWVAWYNLNLIGKDRLPTGDQFFDLPPQPFRPDFTFTISLAALITPVVVGTVIRPIWRSLPDQPAQVLVPDTPQYNLNLYAAAPAETVTRKMLRTLPPVVGPDPLVQSWTWSYNLNLIGKDRLPTGAIYTALPPQSDYSVQLRTWTLSARLSIPFVQRDWPLPIAVPRFDQTWAQWYNQNLIGKDRLPVGDQIYDLAPRDFARLFQTWIQQTNLPLYTVAPLPRPPFNQFDWPLTPAPAQSAQSWTFSYNLNLIGQDKLPVGDQFFEKPAQPPIQLQDTPYFNINLYAPPAAVAALFRVALKPLPDQPATPLLPDAVFPNIALLATVPPVSVIPARIFQMDPPTGPDTLVPSWAWSYNLNLIGKDQLPVGDQVSDLPPRDFARQVQTWIQAVNLALTTAPAQLPKNQFDWPVPRAPQQPAQSFTGSYNLNLIGKDRLPTGARNTDLANPPTPQQPALGLTWRQVGMLGLDRLPTRQMDWPTLLGAIQPDRSFIFVPSSGLYYPPTPLGLPLNAGRISDLVPMGSSPLQQISVYNYNQAFIPIPGASTIVQRTLTGVGL